MKFIKKYYLLLLLIITLAGATIYGTYAMFTSSVETNMVNMDTYMNYTFDINGTQELKVSAGSKLRFNAIVKNSMDGKISYGMYYKMINPSSLPSGVIIAQVSDDLTMLAKGQLESGTSKTVPMVIKNTSDSEITVEIGVRTGYATDSQGVDDIIYNEGEIPITSFQTSEEAGNDSCTSTKTCTSECVERIENGYKNTYCYCLDSSVEYNPAKDTIEKLGLSANEGTPNFGNDATTDEGIYSAQDDYGTSYYFRGAVENNYVKFANKYWRIIRINGDGTIRLIYDGTSTMTCKAFLPGKNAKNIIKRLGATKAVKIAGKVQMDSFSNELTIMANTIVESTPLPKVTRQDNAEVKRVELHMHTKMSAMDAMTSATDLIKRAMKWGMKSIAITDHGVVQAFPEAHKLLGRDNPDMKIIYGVEAYLAPDKVSPVSFSKGQSIDTTYCVLDLETTGFSFRTEKITEIGIMKIKNGEVLDEFSCFVNPEKPIPQRVVEVTNITDDMVKDAPKMDEMIPEFLEFCKGKCPCST